MNYPYLLFDADNTLFDFDKANRTAFSTMCRENDVPDTEENYKIYERCNGALWTAFDRGEVTKDFLVVQRFRDFLAEIGLRRDPEECNRVHLATLGVSHVLLPHAEDVCRRLSKTHKLYLVTNAVASVQRERLRRSTITPYITDAFISEEAGWAKPHTEYFDYVFAHIDGITRDNCIVIGDSLSSDIKGANNYGLPCCWFNPKGVARPTDLRIDYEITDLRQLYDIV